jgi:hypothetical protein
VKNRVLAAVLGGGEVDLQKTSKKRGFLTYFCSTSNTVDRKQKLLGNRKGTKRTTFKIVLPDKENDKEHGDNCWTQPDQVHGGHITRRLHKQGGAALTQHYACNVGNKYKTTGENFFCLMSSLKDKERSLITKKSKKIILIQTYERHLVSYSILYNEFDFLLENLEHRPFDGCKIVI